MNCRKNLTLFLLSALAAGCDADASKSTGQDNVDQTIVKTAQGTVQGATEDGVITFKGIPYAQPPVGNLRWKEPTAPAERTDTLEATSFSKSCTESEDCLYLNVFTPSTIKTDSTTPVLVWIHGGAFSFGNSSYFDGKTIAKENNAVVVTINYRLGALGFLAHPALASDTTQASGNYGIMDQQAALRWVKSNIANFGGDANNVTVMGQSAGGVSVSVLLASPLSKGLFGKAAILSGAYLRDQASLADAKATGEQAATELGCSGQNQAAAECLRALSREQLSTISASNAAYFVPIVDGYVLDKSTYKAFESGDYNQVPVMSGAAKDETYQWGLYFFTADTAPTADSYAAVASSLLTDASVTAAEIAANYQPSDFDAPQPTRAILAAIGDYRFVCGMNSDVENMAKYVPNTWRYEFAESDVTQTGPDSGTVATADWLGYSGDYHSSDLAYWFGQFATSDQTDKNISLSRSMRSYLSSFMREGNPNTDGLPAWSSVVEGGSLLLGTPIANDADVSARHHCDLWSQKAPAVGRLL